MNDDYLTLAQIAQETPGRPSINTVWRWARDGIKAANGEVVRLVHIRAGRRLMVKPSDMKTFLASLAANDLEHFKRRDRTLPQVKSEAPRTPAQRSKATEDAHKRLSAMGL